MKASNIFKNILVVIRSLIVMTTILSQFGWFSSQVSARPSDSHLNSGPASVSPTISGNAGIAGATITYTGGSTIANATGDYSFTVALGWVGTVTPSYTGYTFSPAYRTYVNVQRDQNAQNFMACANACKLNYLPMIIR
jgi:hypothetical protein